MMDNKSVKKKILIIEDEYKIADLLAYSLIKEGFEARTASDGNTGLEVFHTFNPDLVILDVMLPDISGFDICRRITHVSKTPIIILTAKSDIIDKVLGLELGADDYVTKPFDVREILARINSIFRRIEQTVEIKDDRNMGKITVGSDIEIYKNEHTVLKNGLKVELTPKEYELFMLLSQNKGVVFSRSQLLDRVWGFEYPGDTRTVDIHIQRLRKKLDDKDSMLIETVFGVGYKLAR